MTLDPQLLGIVVGTASRPIDPCVSVSMRVGGAVAPIRVRISFGRIGLRSVVSRFFRTFFHAMAASVKGKRPVNYAARRC